MLNNHHPPTTSESSEKSNRQNCPRCRSIDLFTQKKPPHVGLHCHNCGRWIRWISQRPLENMPFGKYRSVPIRALPNDYLVWILTNVELQNNLRRALEGELERRDGETA